MNKRIVISFSGPSCVGKSAISSELAKLMSNTYTVSYDHLKWQVSNYNRNKHKKFVKNLLFDFFSLVCTKKVPIILISWFNSKAEYNKYKKVADSCGYKFLYIKLTAPDDILLKRFRDRVKSAKKAGSKISVTNESLFLKNNKAAAKYIPKTTLTFDTSKKSAKVIAKEILISVKR